jgi:hypothetical protein
MSFGFFDWLRVRTRDAVLDGASEAGRVLEQGVEAADGRTESVATMEERTTRAMLTPGGTPVPREAAAALPQAPPKPERREAPSPKPGPPAKPEPPSAAQGRLPKRTAKTEAIFDARPGSNP